MSEFDKMEIARVMVGQGNAVHIHSGNLINWSTLKKKVALQSSEELLDSLNNATNSWLQSLDPMSLEEPLSVINITDRRLLKKLDEDQRERLKISVKVFLTQWKAELAKKAVTKVCEELDVESLDSVILSFPITPLTEITNNNNGSMLDFSKVKIIWKELESMVDSGKIAHLGVTDFDKTRMEELYNWARARACVYLLHCHIVRVKLINNISELIKPTIDQVNMTNCCTVPADLLDFSKLYDIELLSHNDAPEIITARAFQEIMQDKFQDMNATEWVPLYVARYSVIVRCRGIIEAKGYVVRAERQASSGEYSFF